LSNKTFISSLYVKRPIDQECDQQRPQDNEDQVRVDQEAHLTYPLPTLIIDESIYASNVRKGIKFKVDLEMVLEFYGVMALDPEQVVDTELSCGRLQEDGRPLHDTVVTCTWKKTNFGIEVQATLVCKAKRCSNKKQPAMCILGYKCTDLGGRNCILWTKVIIYVGHKAKNRYKNPRYLREPMKQLVKLIKSPLEYASTTPVGITTGNSATAPVNIPTGIFPTTPNVGADDDFIDGSLLNSDVGPLNDEDRGVGFELDLWHTECDFFHETSGVW